MTRAEDWARLKPPWQLGTGELDAVQAGSGLDLLLAIDSSAARHLLIPIGSESEGATDHHSRGLRADTRPLAVASQPERLFIDLACAEPTAHHQFDALSGEVVDLIGGGMPPATAVVQTLARWRRFWGAAPLEGLSEDEIRGLFGELWFLDVWLLSRSPSAVRHWLGPAGSRHDFQWAGVGIESKATTSVRGHIHWINGIDQLDPPEGGTLYVFSLRLREEASAQNTLPALVERIQSSLATESELLDLFEVRLAQAGYSHKDRIRYLEVRFRVIDERLYSVGPGFPRLSAASFAQGVPPGIETVRYEVNLESAATLLVTSSASGLPTLPE